MGGGKYGVWWWWRRLERREARELGHAHMHGKTGSKEFAECLALRVVSDLYVRGEWSQSECMTAFAQIIAFFC